MRLSKRMGAKKNATNTVSIDITEFYDEYKNGLFVEIDDYALNNNMYYINLDYSKRVFAVCGKPQLVRFKL